MLNSVACKSSGEGTFSTKRLIATIVACGVLRVNSLHLPWNVCKYSSTLFQIKQKSSFLIQIASALRKIFSSNKSNLITKEYRYTCACIKLYFCKKKEINFFETSTCWEKSAPGRFEPMSPPPIPDKFLNR